MREPHAFEEFAGWPVAGRSQEAEAMARHTAHRQEEIVAYREIAEQQRRLVGAPKPHTDPLVGRQHRDILTEEADAATRRREVAGDDVEQRRLAGAIGSDHGAPLPDGYPSPSLFALVYYLNMKATLDGLEAVNGDLSDGQKKYREALTKLVLKTPVGDVKLDQNRQAIGTTFITEVVKDGQGNLYNKVLRKIDNVNQTLGIPPAEFKIGSRDEPNCP